MSFQSFLLALIAWIHIFDSPKEASEKGLRGLQQSPPSLLKRLLLVHHLSVINYYAVVKYKIHNSGDDFSPAFAYKGEADCHKPAIFNFLHLEGLIPSVKLSRHATCVVDDELADGEDACTSSTSKGMTIRSGKSYGNTKAVSAKFTIADSDFATLYNAAATTQLDLKLSVNSLISPAVSGEVSVLKGSELGSADWFNPAVFPDPI
eukprot:gene35591-46156_t